MVWDHIMIMRGGILSSMVKVQWRGILSGMGPHHDDLGRYFGGILSGMVEV